MDYLKELEELEKRKQELLKEALEHDDIKFEVWSKYAEKEDYSFISEVEDSSIYDLICRNCETRYTTVFWYDILRYLEWEWEEVEDFENDEEYKKELEDICEDLISYNLNSICMDW